MPTQSTFSSPRPWSSISRMPMGRTSITQPEKLGAVDQHQHIERVAVVAQGAGDEAVVARIVDGRVEIAVQTEDVQFLVVLVLVDALAGDFDDDVDDLGAVWPDGQLHVVRHKFGFSSLL